jgi:glutaminase
MLTAGKLVALSSISPRQVSFIAETAAGGTGLAVFADKDLALEWCENRLLQNMAPQIENSPVSVAENELCAGLDNHAIRLLESAARQVCFEFGETIVRSGEKGESVYLLVSGDVSVTADLSSGGTARLATLSAGMTFGEMALLGEKVRSANVTADSNVECYELRLDDLARLGESDPAFSAAIYENLARKLAGNLRRANAEVQALSGVAAPAN